MNHNNVLKTEHFFLVLVLLFTFFYLSCSGNPLIREEHEFLLKVEDVCSIEAC
jgi:hypothetical protein